MRNPLVQFLGYAALSLALGTTASAQESASQGSGHYLRWPGKTTVAAPRPPVSTAPVSPTPVAPTPVAPAPVPPAHMTPPEAKPATTKVVVAPVQQKPAPQYTVPKPQVIEKPAPIATVTPPAPKPEPKVTPPTPQPAPMPQAASQPQPQPQPQPMTDGAYQVPASSKYAQRIANARAAQGLSPAPVTMAPIANPAPSTPAPSTPTASPAKATAPEASEPLSAEQTDHVFIPGETITNDETQRPRFYSLHRQYGITPDAIDVTPGDTSGLLEVPYDTQAEGEDAKAPNDSQP